MDLIVLKKLLRNIPDDAEFEFQQTNIYTCSLNIDISGDILIINGLPFEPNKSTGWHNWQKPK